MRFFYFLLLLPFTCSAQILFADDGGSSFGNGGHSVVCFSPEERKWTDPRTLDLFEGSQKLKYSYPELHSDEEAEALALKLARKIDAAVGFDDFIGRRAWRNYTVTSKVRWVMENRHYVDYELQHTDDSKVGMLPYNCRLRQTVNFGSRILVNRPLWESHSFTDRAALLLHEAIYWYLRGQARETDSRRVRRLVAYLMTGQPLVSVIDPVLKASERNQICRSKSLFGSKETEIYATTGYAGTLQLHLRRLQNFRMLSRTVLQGPKVEGSMPLGESGLDFSGELLSVADRNSILNVHWDAEKQELHLQGLFEGDYPVDDTLTCEPVSP